MNYDNSLKDIEIILQVIMLMTYHVTECSSARFPMFELCVISDMHTK